MQLITTSDECGQTLQWRAELDPVDENGRFHFALAVAIVEEGLVRASIESKRIVFYPQHSLCATLEDFKQMALAEQQRLSHLMTQAQTIQTLLRVWERISNPQKED